MQFFGKMYLNFTLHILASLHLQWDLDKIPFQLGTIMQKRVDSCFPSLLINKGIPFTNVIFKYNPNFFQTKIHEIGFEGTLK